MLRTAVVFALLGLAALGQEPASKRVLRTRLVTGQRFTGSNIIAYRTVTTIRQGLKEESETESVKRTERFVDVVHRAGFNGVLEIDRSYLKLFSSAQRKGEKTKTVYRSPLQGRQVHLTERNRRRDIKLEGRGAIDPFVRRTAGLELDWRDIFPEEPVGPGDAWDAEAAALSRRVAAYLDSGNRGRMRVRYEEDIERDGRSFAKLYVDWTIEGMRDRKLFTKVVLAGDVLFDHELQRVVEVDLTGTMVVRGALIGDGAPRIVKGEGPVSYKCEVKFAPLEAASVPEAPQDR